MNRLLRCSCSMPAVFVMLLCITTASAAPTFSGKGIRHSGTQTTTRGATLLPGDLVPDGTSPAFIGGFLENRGQIFDSDGARRNDVLYTAGEGAMRAFFAKDRVSYVFTRFEIEPPADGSESETDLKATKPGATKATSYRVDLEIVGANPACFVHAENEEPLAVRFYTGTASFEARSYGILVYENVYPSIDLAFRLDEGRIKYEFRVHPGGKISDIRLRYTGAGQLGLEPDGALKAVCPLGDIRDAAPVSYQTKSSDYIQPAGAPALRSSFLLDGNDITFDIAQHDASTMLVIDPTVQWSTYYGGGNVDHGTGISSDPSGNVYVTGYTYSTNLPVTAGALQTSNAGNYDAFVVKFNALGTRQWATYIGGALNDFALGIANDVSGNIAITGETNSQNYPNTGAFQSFLAGATDAFLSRLNSAGVLQWSTYLGGAGDETGFGVAFDGAGNVAITGETSSVNFPVSSAAFQPSLAGVDDAFVGVFTPGGLRQWLTYYGGTFGDIAKGVTYDAAGNILITGGTASSNFPITAGAFQGAQRGAGDAFLVKMSGGGARIWATYVGGSNYDLAGGITSDDSSRAIIVGQTESNDLSVGVGAYRGFRSGGDEAFLFVFNANGAREWATYYGGNLDDVANGVDADKHGNITFVGTTYSGNFPVSPSTIQGSRNGTSDAFAVKFSRTGGRLWATYFGGGGDDAANAVAMQASGNVLMTGWTGSANFPILSGYQLSYAGGIDAFATKICDVKPIITPSGPTNLCAGGSVILDAGDGYSVYSWSTGASTRTITVSTPGRYAVSVSDGIGCNGLSDSITVNVAAPLFAEGGPNQSICFGNSILIGGLPTGGVAPYQYRWTPSTGLNDSTIARPLATPTATTKYYVTVTDAYNCTNRDSVVVTISPNPAVNAGRDTLLCYGSSVVIGNLATGGTPPYTYHWSPSTGLNDDTLAQPTAQPTSTTTYTVTATDANGCTGIDQVVVRIDRVIADAGVNKSICGGDSVLIGGTRNFGIGTLSYSWSPSTGLSATNIARPRAFPTVTTSYTLTVTDSAGCVDTDVMVVSVYGSLTALGGPDRSICYGSATVIGDTAVCGTGPYTYHWSPPTGLSDTAAQRPTASPLTNTTYYLRVTDAALNTHSDTVVVIVDPLPVAHAGPDTLICAGTSVQIGAIATGGTGPFSYSWSPSTGLSSSTVATPTATPSATTRYIVRVSDVNGCSDLDTVFVSISTLAVNSGADQTICLNDSVFIGNAATGGTPGYTYLWVPSAGLSSNAVARPKASPATTTTYYQFAQDQRGCVVLDSVVVFVHPLPIAEAGPGQVICRFEATQIGDTARGGRPPYTYAWTPATGLSSTTIMRPVARPLTSTQYYLTVTDANGCRSRDSVVVLVRPWPTVNAGADVTICRGDSIRIGNLATGGSGPYHYRWTPTNYLSDSLSATPMVRPFFPTRYTVTVTDSNGCQDTDDIFVGVEPRPSATITASGPATFCEGDSIRLSVDPTRIYSGYAWYRDTTFVDTARAIIAKESGLYRVHVNTTNGCSGEAIPVQVVVIPLPRPRITTSGPLTFCEGGSVTFESDSSYQWTFLWSDGTIGRKKVVTTSGSYYLTVTGPNGCVNTSPVFIVTVHPQPVPVIKPEGPTSFCAGGRVVLDADQAGVFTSYLWSNGARTRKITVTQSGSYSVTVANSEGCLGTSPAVPVQVNPIPVPVITTSSGNLTFCEGGSVTLEAPVGYSSYLWSNGANTRTTTVDQAGTYTVTVISNTGCQGTSTPVTVTVRPLPRPVVTAMGPTAFCAGDSVILDAGAGYTSYQWSNGRRTRTISVKTAGTFSVTVTDANGCRGTSGQTDITVYANPSPVITANGALSFCPGDSVVLDAGSGYSSYQWSNGESTSRIVVKTSGTFTVTVTNATNCIGTSAPVTVTRYQTPAPQITANGPLSFCEGGSVQLDAGSGWSRYLWSTGATTRRITVSQSGLYNVRVTNTNGCNGESPVLTITVKPNPLIPLITQSGNTIVSTPATRYQWNFSGAPIAGATQRTYNPPRNGQYTVTVWNADSCSSTSAPFDFRAVGIFEDEKPVAGFSVYPDPNQGLVTVDLRLDTPASVRLVLMDMLGRIVYEQSEDQTMAILQKLDIQKLPDGLYFLHVTAGKQTLMRKLLKQ